jgi:hypothetical protein
MRKTGNAKKPIIYGLNSDRQKVEIEKNPSAYRFCFIEKNRIDNFARIAATTPNNQKDRIATLFGLDAFSEFVDGFTDNFGDNKYLTLINKKELELNEENHANETSKTRVLEIEKDLAELEGNTSLLLKDISQEKLSSLEELRIFLVGEDGTKGIINSLQEKKASSVQGDVDISIVGRFTNEINKMKELLDSLTFKISELSKSSSEVNFKGLYSAIESIAKDCLNDKSICPACKTPMNKVMVNPFDNAVSELMKMGKLASLQNEIETEAISLSKKTREANNEINKLNTIKKTIGNFEPSLPVLTEFAFTGIVSIHNWKETFANEFRKLYQGLIENEKLTNDIKVYNFSLQLKRNEKEKVGRELLGHQKFKQRYDEIIASQTNLLGEKTKHQAKITEFLDRNDLKIKEIEQLSKKIAINNEYVKSYEKIISNLKEYRNGLPSLLAAGLSDKTKEFYNVINAHDPVFEKLESLKLPTEAGEKITIRFHGDKKEHDALLILSEGHIKVLGLSLLLSKVVSEDLGFIIFDDIVNAIDDEHRDGIAELLLLNPALKDRQHIITCHGDIFINKLEHKLGASTAGKEVKGYRFLPSDSFEERGIKISVGTSKHYLLLAKKSLEEDARKDVASRCRQAIESISEQLWNKLCKKLNINLTVKMRSPGARPDLSSVVASLIKELQGISGSSELLSDFRKLKEKYSWSLLNKGTHEQGDLPELERQDVSDLLNLVENIEAKVAEVKLEVSSV